MACKFAGTCPGSSHWCDNPGNQDNCARHWKQEAQEQTAEAGELRINLAVWLDEIRMRMAEVKGLLLTEDNNLDQVILQFKLQELQKQEERLEQALK